MFKLLAESHPFSASNSNAWEIPACPLEAVKLYSITYVSTAVHKLSKEQLSSLTQKANLRNKSLGVAGLLLYSDGNFMQCLEGSKESIDRLMQSIASDHRHGGLLVLWEGEIPNRAFVEFGLATRSPDAGLRPVALPQPFDSWLNTAIDKKILPRKFCSKTSGSGLMNALAVVETKNCGAMGERTARRVRFVNAVWRIAVVLNCSTIQDWSPQHAFHH